MERKVNDIMISWGHNYFILEVMTLGCGYRYCVKTCINKEWEQRNFYSPKRVISYYRSLRKADLSSYGSLLQNLYRVQHELLMMVLNEPNFDWRNNEQHTQLDFHLYDMTENINP